MNTALAVQSLVHSLKSDCETTCSGLIMFSVYLSVFYGLLWLGKDGHNFLAGFTPVY